MTTKPTTKRTAITEAMRAKKMRKIMRVIAICGASMVGLVALWISYGHIYHVARMAGESHMNAMLIPVGIDGLLIVAGVAIVSGRKDYISYGSFSFGVIASLCANIISAEGSILSYGIAGIAPIALVGASEMLLRMFFPQPTKRKKPIAKKTVNPATSRTSRKNVDISPVLVTR